MSNQYTIKVIMTVKAPDRDSAEIIVAARLNEWFVSDAGDKARMPMVAYSIGQWRRR